MEKKRYREHSNEIRCVRVHNDSNTVINVCVYIRLEDILSAPLIQSLKDMMNHDVMIIINSS